MDDQQSKSTGSRLKVIEKIEFDTSAGPKTIQLLYGDITALPLEQKADLLMLSAFHGDYTPTRTSLIGALYREFSLYVGELARDKEEDFRKLFHCWWSKPLPDKLPYKRILCFESSASGVAPQKAVQAIFKALVPACSLFTNGEIISPLLSTGNQGFSEEQMLRAIINSAVVWMQNGLNIKLFKLAIYIGNDKILNTFKDLKRIHNILPGSEMRFRSIRTPVPRYDFFMSYAPQDKQNAERVRQVFSQHKDTAKFFTVEDWKNKSDLTEEDIFTVMKTCSRVITFLSPSFLEDDDRVEEYNAAWCLNRQTTSFTRLAPMLCELVSGLPTYMSLIQWVDIRMQNGNTEKMIRNITLYMVGYVQEVGGDIDPSAVKSTSVKSRVPAVKAAEEAAGAPSLPAPAKHEYDVFISYAHANEPTCKYVVDALTKQIPGVRLFVDRDELRTGGSWQQKLYHAVESTHVTIALLSEAYLRSKMCNEEFKLSLARHFTDDDYHLVPIQIEQVKDLEDMYTSVRNSADTAQDFNTHVDSQLVPAIKAYLSEGKCDGVFLPLGKAVYSLTKLLEDGRCTRLMDLIATEVVSYPQSSADIQIQILSSREPLDSGIAAEIKKSLGKIFGFKAHLSLDYSDTATVLKQLDDCDLIVALVSPDFLKDPDLIEELQVAINRHRYDASIRLYPVLLTSQLDADRKNYHLYCELLTYDLCLMDPVWDSFVLDQTFESHANYKDMMAKCGDIDAKFDEKYQEWTMNGSHEDELRLKRLNKDLAKRQIKFVSTICNRVAYQIKHKETPENQVLINVFQIIKEVVLEKDSLDRQKEVALEKIGKSYKQESGSSPDPICKKIDSTHQEDAGATEKESTGKVKHSDNEKSKSSQACTLL